MTDELCTQTFPYPHDLRAAVDELMYLDPPWKVRLTHEDRGQGCVGLTLSVYPDKRDSYHPENHVHTVFLYPVPAAAFNRESWEEWLFARISETEDHERAENFKFKTLARPEVHDLCTCGHQATRHDGRFSRCVDCDGPKGEGSHRFEPAEPRFEYRRPFKPAHADGWDPGTVRTVVSDTVTNTPNAGRLVQIPCGHCPHHHGSRMGEHFTVASVGPCSEDGCDCPWRGKIEPMVDNARDQS